MAVGITYRDEKIKEKPLPPITFCPWPGFKKRGFYFNKLLLDENTFGLEDIFQPKTVKDLRNKTAFEIKEIKNHMTGKCFMIRSLISSQKGNGVYLHLKKKFDLTLFIHSIEDEFWINFSWFPTLISKVFLTVKSLEDVAIGILHLTEKEMTKMNQENVPCKTYEKTKNPHSKFIDCRKKLIINSHPWSELQCFMPGFDDVVPSIELRECTNISEAAKASDFYNNLKWRVNNQVRI